jgi:hypothetical protein
MAGYYKARAELYLTSIPYVSSPWKSGTGSAELVVTGDPTNTEDVNYAIAAQSTGEIGTALIAYSLDNGSTWEKTGIVSMSSMTPLSIKNGLKIYFNYGPGTDLVAGDWFGFTSIARRTTYRMAGAPFQEISNVYFNGTETFDVVKDTNTGMITLVGSSGLVDVRVVKSSSSNPIEIIKDILNIVGLLGYIDTNSFSNAKMDLADYQIGVKFEGVPAWKAIQSICMTCLIWFWIDANKIYVSAYTGQSA